MFHQDKVERLVFWRSFLAPKVAARWREFIDGYYKRAGADGPGHRVFAKPLRSYMHRAFGPKQRLSALLAHYHWMDERFSPNFIRQLCLGDALDFAVLAGKKGAVFHLRLSASIVLATQREGELAIAIVRAADNFCLSRISFSFAPYKNGQALVIGGVQGPETGFKRDVIDATRNLYGLRPKDAVLLAVRAVAEEFAPCPVLAVSDANHILRRLQDVSKHSSYDEYWRERGALPGSPFGFVFGPLAALADLATARERAKSEIIAGISALLRANRLMAEPKLRAALQVATRAATA